MLLIFVFQIAVDIFGRKAVLKCIQWVFLGLLTGILWMDIENSFFFYFSENIVEKKELFSIVRSSE